jgi:hypothetical protein
MGRVHGTVTIDGKPLASGSVVTLPNSGRGARGLITNGEFDLGTSGTTDGAIVGKHKFAVSAQEQQQGGPEGPAGKLLVPERYTNPETSGFTFDVKPGDNNFELKLTTP